MKSLIVFLSICVVGFECANNCFNVYDSTCTSQKPMGCSSKTGLLSNLLSDDLDNFAKNQLSNSYLFLILSSFYGSYLPNRPGLQKLYSELSDETWEDTINIIKHMTMRGLSPNFNNYEINFNDGVESKENDAFELKYLSKTVDIYKSMATKADELVNKKEPEITHYIEERFLGKFSEKIRKLVGYVNDLSRIPSALGTQIFDMNLAK